MNSKEIPIPIKMAARRFRRNRADYFDYLADIIEGSEGKKKFQQIFEQDGERFVGKPRGVLSRYWAQTFSENGASLRLTWTQLFPDDELALLDVAQQAGSGAIITTLRDVAEGVRLKQQIESKARATALISGIGLLVAFFMATIYPIMSTSFMKEAFPMIPSEYIRPVAKKWFLYASFVETAFPFLVGLAALAAAYIYWCINNLVGGARDWLDRKNFFFRTIRDVRSVMFLTTLATISKQRGASSMPLQKALAMFHSSSRSPWLSWRIKQVLDNIDRSGGVSSDVFNTNILSEDIFYYLRDMEQARGFSEGFSQTSKYVKERILSKIGKKLNIYKYIILGVAGAVVFSIYSTQITVIKAMTNSTKSYYTDSQR